MKRLILALALGATVLSRTAMANWSVPVTIVDIEVSDTSTSGKGPARVYLHFSGAPFLAPCTNSSSGQWAVGGVAENIKNIMTIATAAKLAGRQVRVFWNELGSNRCSDGGTNGYPVVTGLTLQ